MTATGSVIRPAPDGHGEQVALGDAEPRRPWRRTAGRPARGAVPARNGSPSCRRPASSRWCQVARTAWPPSGCGDLGAPARSGRRGAGALPRAEGRASRRGPRAMRAQSRGTRPSRRRACRGPGGRSWRWSPAPPRRSRTRPSQLTKVPAFSACAATGSTTSATAVTARLAELERDDERARQRVQRPRRARRGRPGRRRRRRGRRARRRRPPR